MRALILPVSLLTLLLLSCRVTEKNMPGTYQEQRSPGTWITLKEDRSFEFVMDASGKAAPSLAGNPPLNFITGGEWIFDHRSVILNSHSRDSSVSTATLIDSIARFTSISSFHFWNRYGQPVPIRSILLPPFRPKPHYGNSLYFFAQDFKRADTLKFYFIGYPVFTYPGSIPYSIGNNMHKITLLEPYRQDVFINAIFSARKNRLQSDDGQLLFRKKNKAPVSGLIHNFVP